MACLSLSQSTGHSLASSTFAQSVRRLVDMGLCEVVGGRVRFIERVRKDMTA